MGHHTIGRYIIIPTLIFIFGCSDPVAPKLQGKTQTFSRYELVQGWPKLPEGFTLGQVTGVDVDSSQNIFLIHRAWRQWTIFNVFPDTPIAANTVVALDGSSGKLLNSWGTNLFIMPHGLTVDHQNNVWITDVGLQQVFQFSHDGVLLMTLGEARVAGNDNLHFNYPTDVAVAHDGSFYVADGYRNSRVIKFSMEGQYLFEWGQKGRGEGEFDTPHGIDLDSEGNVYVADRENNRIQKFDPQGKFIRQWQNNMGIQLYSLAVDSRNDQVFAVDFSVEQDSLVKGSDVIGLDTAMSLLGRFGRSGLYKGPVCRYHDITMDREGNIYVGDILGNRIQKFRQVSR
jgi:peptidylamidoglycolate lyase